MLTHKDSKNKHLHQKSALNKCEHVTTCKPHIRPKVKKKQQPCDHVAVQINHSPSRKDNRQQTYLYLNDFKVLTGQKTKLGLSVLQRG